MKVRCKLLQYLLQHIPHLLTSLCRFTETSDIGETLQHLKDKSFADFYRNMESHLGVALLLRQTEPVDDEFTGFLFCFSGFDIIILLMGIPHKEYQDDGVMNYE